MKKIVHITNDLKRLGGVQRLLVDLLSLQLKEFEFEIILTRGENEYAEELAQMGVSVYHRKDIGLIGIIKRLNKADLVHAHLFPSLYIALLSLKPTIVTEHNPHYRRRDLLFVKSLESILFRKFKKVLCISPGVQESFLKIINIKRSSTQVVLNGVNLSRFPMLPRLYETLSDKFKIGMVGRLVPQKDIKTLLDLMANLDDSFELHVAGDGELRSEFELYAKEINVDKKVIFHGQVNDIPKFLNSIDLYIQSSFEEGFGLAVVEAMASGLPCLATNVDGLNNVIDAPYRFEVGDVKYLVKEVKKLANSEVLYNQYSLYAVKKACKFTIVNAAAEHTKIYKSFILKNDGK